MKKLDIHDTAGLTRYAISAGIIECDVELTILQTSGSTADQLPPNQSRPRI